MANSDDISVFEYLDYRGFLRDYYVDRKNRRGLSYRALSKRAGLRSSNYFKLVIDGERNLTDEMAQRFARAVGLEGDGAEFFLDLVRFNQAKALPARMAAYERLTRFKKYREIHPLALEQGEYHSRWYLPAIRELAARADFQEDPAWIARKLVPEITPSEASKGLQTLLRLGLLSRKESGEIVQAQSVVTTGPEARSIQVAVYHAAMMQMAKRSLDEIAAVDRDISSLTLCLGPGGLERLKKRLQRFRRELLDMAALDEEPRQVVQVNFQLFPLSTD